jgi:hypothetical protein
MLAGRRGFYNLPYKMSKKGPFEGILGAFWIFLYGMLQRPFDPSQGPFVSSPLLVYHYFVDRDAKLLTMLQDDLE